MTRRPAHLPPPVVPPLVQIPRHPANRQPLYAPVKITAPAIEFSHPPLLLRGSIHY